MTGVEWGPPWLNQSHAKPGRVVLFQHWPGYRLANRVKTNRLQYKTCPLKTTWCWEAGVMVDVTMSYMPGLFCLALITLTLSLEGIHCHVSSVFSTAADCWTFLNVIWIHTELACLNNTAVLPSWSLLLPLLSTVCSQALEKQNST